MTDLPPYTIRVSRRARKVSLVVSSAAGLQVVIPTGFDPGRVPEVVRQKQAWIQRALRRLSAHPSRGASAPEPITLPREVTLLAADAKWQVIYRPGAPGSVTLTETTGRRLVLKGGTQNVKLCRAALKWWLSRHAHKVLGAWLTELSSQVNLPFARISIRGQRTRWGSCSSRGSISLNYKLLFLPRPLVRYVLLHELCHGRQPNHSAAFWALLADMEPDYRRLRNELRAAGQVVPAWAQ